MIGFPGWKDIIIWCDAGCF